MTRHQPRRFQRALLLATATSLTICLFSCVSPDAVAKFASESEKSLNQGTVIFDDFPGSVVRRDCDADVENRDFDFKPPEEACVNTGDEQANLALAKKDRDDVIAVQKVLIDYLDAMQQLAAFGKATDSDNKSKKDASSGSSAANSLKSRGKLTSSDEEKAVVSLGEIIVKIFSAAYRDRQLSRDIGSGDAAVASITGALTHIVRDDYMFHPESPATASLLNVEANRMREQYKGADGGRMLLRVSFTERSRKLLARNSSANNYVEALEQIRSGHHQIAAQSSPLKAQALVVALQPYISKLESLIPQILKVF